MKLLTFLCRYNNWIGFRRKLRKGGAVVRHLPPFPRGGGVGTPYNGFYGEAPTERGTFFMLQVYERVGLFLVLFLVERFFSGCSGFPLSPKTSYNLSKFHFDPQRTTRLSEFSTTFKCSMGKQITTYNFIYLMFRLIPWSRKNWRCRLTGMWFQICLILQGIFFVREQIDN